jgi:hypothetical protein
MSNADDNQGRRGLFRRNRSADPVASNPPTGVETPNPEIDRNESAPDPERKPNRRPGLGRRKAASDGSWSSDAWEDGWDDDWSDRSSRAGVRPAADPRPAEVDAWLASSDDQLGDITRDIARKWTGTKQPAPTVAAITWADDVPATPSSALVNDPSADDGLAASLPSDSTELQEGVWGAPESDSEWSSGDDLASEVDFELEPLVEPQNPVPAVNLGSTWDDVEPAVEPQRAGASPVEIVEEITAPVVDHFDALQPEVEPTEIGDVDGNELVLEPVVQESPVDEPLVAPEPVHQSAIQEPLLGLEAIVQESEAGKQVVPQTDARPAETSVTETPPAEAPAVIETSVVETRAVTEVAETPVAQTTAAAESSHEVPRQASVPVERDEFLESLYEEFDDEDAGTTATTVVPSERKTAFEERALEQLEDPASQPEFAKPNSVDLETAVTSVATDAATDIDLPANKGVGEENAEQQNRFTPRTAEADRGAEQFAVAQQTAGTLVPQDPNADFDFGPDRPVYLPTNPSTSTAELTPTTLGNLATAQASALPTFSEVDDDLFPPTKADRFGAALDELEDDQAAPSGLGEPAVTKRGFLRGRKNRSNNAGAVERDEVESIAQATAQELNPNDEPETQRETLAATTEQQVESFSPSVRNAAPHATTQTENDEEEFDDPDDFESFDDDYPEDAYFSPKLTKLLSQAGFLLVALAAIRMLVLVGIAVKDGAKDALGTQDVFHRVGSAFADLGIAHGLMLLVGIALAAAPALLGDPYLDDQSRPIGSTFGIGLVSAVFGLFGGFAAARLAMRVNDIASASNPEISSTTQWAKLAMNLVATAGLSLIAVVAAIRALGGETETE